MIHSDEVQKYINEIANLEDISEEAVFLLAYAQKTGLKSEEIPETVKRTIAHEYDTWMHEKIPPSYVVRFIENYSFPEYEDMDVLPLGIRGTVHHLFNTFIDENSYSRACMLTCISFTAFFFSRVFFIFKTGFSRFHIQLRHFFFGE